MAENAEPAMTPGLYAESMSAWFTVDGYSARHHAMVLPARIEAARQIYAAVPAISEEASARLSKYLERRGIAMPRGGAACRRSLELVGHLIAGVAVGENVAQFEAHVLRHLVVEVEHGLEIPDGNAMVLMFAIASAREKLAPAPRRLFEGYGWHAVEYVRSGSAGAALAARAHELAEEVVARLVESVPMLDEEYGREMRAKCVRDVSMMLGAAPITFASASRQDSAAQVLEWIFDQVAGEVPHFAGRVWGPIFRHLWEVSLTKLEPAHGQVAGEIWKQLRRAAPRLREGFKLHSRARDLGRRAAYAALSSGPDSTGDVSRGAAIASACESLVRRAAVHHALRHSPAQSGLARQWLQFHANRLPAPSAAISAQVARALRDTVRTTMKDACDAGLDALLDAVVSASDRFGEINRQNVHLPELATRVSGAGTRPERAAARRHLLTFASKTFEVAARGTLFETNDLLWTWHGYCLDPGQAQPAELLAEMYAALPDAYSALAGPERPVHLAEFLADVADSAKHLPAAALLRSDVAWDCAKEAIAEARLRDRPVPPNELVFFLDRVAHAMLRGGTEAAVTQLCAWYGAHCIAHHHVPEPHPQVEKLFRALQDATRKRLPEGSRLLFERVMDGFAIARPFLLAAPAIRHHAPEIAKEAVARVVTTREWRENVIGAQQARCERDVRLLLLVIAHHFRTGGPDVENELRAWGKDNLLPFLSDGSKRVIPPLLSQVEEVAGAKLHRDVTAPLLAGMRAVYGQKSGW